MAAKDHTVLYYAAYVYLYCLYTLLDDIRP